MKMFWLAVLVFVMAAAGIVWYSLRRFKLHKLAEEARLADFVAASTSKTKFVVPVAAGDDLAPQKLLFESAHKAGEAGEPALAIQLYARLLSRYPASSFDVQARVAVAALKKKLGKA